MHSLDLFKYYLRFRQRVGRICSELGISRISYVNEQLDSIVRSIHISEKLHSVILDRLNSSLVLEVRI